MKPITTLASRTNILEAALFAAVACLALTAGYASLTTQSRVSNADITGSTHPSSAAPLGTMQAMPEPIEPQH